jgi:hypothetical protein
MNIEPPPPSHSHTQPEAEEKVLLLGPQVVAGRVQDLVQALLLLQVGLDGLVAAAAPADGVVRQAAVHVLAGAVRLHLHLPVNHLLQRLPGEVAASQVELVDGVPPLALVGSAGTIAHGEHGQRGARGVRSGGGGAPLLKQHRVRKERQVNHEAREGVQVT